MAEIRKLWKRRNAAILVWPGEEPLEIGYNAQRIVVPPRDVVARLGQGSPFTHASAVDANGKPMPGTILLEDVIVMTKEGGYLTVLDIDKACHYLTTQRDDLFTQGFNVVENTSDVAQAMALGRPLYEESQDKRAREILSRELQRQKAYKDRGEVPPPALSEHLVTWAMKHLQRRPQRQAHKLEDLQAALEGREAEPTVASPPQAGAAAAVPPQAPGEDVMQLYVQAQSLHVSVNAQEMAGLLRGNPDVIEKVKLKVRDKLAEKEQAQASDAA